MPSELRQISPAAPGDRQTPSPCGHCVRAPRKPRNATQAGRQGIHAQTGKRAAKGHRSEHRLRRPRPAPAAGSTGSENTRPDCAQRPRSPATLPRRPAGRCNASEAAQGATERPRGLRQAVTGRHAAQLDRLRPRSEYHAPRMLSTPAAGRMPREAPQRPQHAPSALRAQIPPQQAGSAAERHRAHTERTQHRRPLRHDMHLSKSTGSRSRRKSAGRNRTRPRSCRDPTRQGTPKSPGRCSSPGRQSHRYISMTRYTMHNAKSESMHRARKSKTPRAPPSAASDFLLYRIATPSACRQGIRTASPPPAATVI